MMNPHYAEDSEPRAESWPFFVMAKPVSAASLTKEILEANATLVY